MTRHFIFRNYLWLAAFVALLAIALIAYFYRDGRMPLIGSVLATALAFFYFVQQQRLAEISLFKSLFTEFNARYDKINGDLSQILGAQEELSPAHAEVVIDYFNLCAEEYLFYKEGYIHQDVWRSWCRGMLCYLEQTPFADIWEKEQVSDSYYGLSLRIIRKGARSKRSLSKLASLRRPA